MSTNGGVLFGFIILAACGFSSANYSIKAAKVDGGDKEVVFLVNEDTGKDIYWIDSFVDDIDADNPKVVRALKKVEKDFNDEYSKYLAKKNLGSGRAE